MGKSYEKDNSAECLRLWGFASEVQDVSNLHVAKHEVPVRGEGWTPSTLKVLHMVGARLRFDMSSVCGVQHCSHEVTTRHRLQNHGI